MRNPTKKEIIKEVKDTLKVYNLSLTLRVYNLSSNILKKQMDKLEKMMKKFE